MATSQFKKFQRGGGSSSIYPWDLIISSDEKNQLSVSVIPGLLLNYLPTNWDIVKKIDNTSFYYAKACLSTNGIAFTNVTIKIDTTPPKIQEPQINAIESTVEVLFGLIKAGSVYRTIPNGNIYIWPAVWLSAQKNYAVTVGESLYDNYYYLK
ncbi:MAG: hypothetical protein RIQ48_701 [Pseudomonadota bacterium]|jgi:hypothetical protein